MSETDTKILNDLRILVVDDERDILETIEDLLDGSDVAAVDNYQSALDTIRAQHLDLAVLDIMGVNGMQLLNDTVALGIPTVMLTAHSLNPETLRESLDAGALAYLPKEELSNLDTFLADIVETHRAGQSTTALLFDKLGKFFDRAFGNHWARNDIEVWQAYGYFPPF
jgi:DNA-binding NtrC family response regulator